MQFQVPQFIEVEDRIFGPFTFRQFVYITGGAGSAYLIYRLLPVWLALPFMGGAVALAAALAFYEYNGRPFILAIEAGFHFIINPKLYLWSNKQSATNTRSPKAMVVQNQSDIYVPKLSESKLHELSWSLDIRERISSGIADESERGQAPVALRTARNAIINRAGQPR
jgi:hypothetical protein